MQSAGISNSSKGEPGLTSDLYTVLQPRQSIGGMDTAIITALSFSKVTNNEGLYFHFSLYINTLNIVFLWEKSFPFYISNKVSPSLQEIARPQTPVEKRTLMTRRQGLLLI